MHTPLIHIEHSIQALSGIFGADVLACIPRLSVVFYADADSILCTTVWSEATYIVALYLCKQECVMYTTTYKDDPV